MERLRSRILIVRPHPRLSQEKVLMNKRMVLASAFVSVLAFPAGPSVELSAVQLAAPLLAARSVRWLAEQRVRWWAV